LKNKLWIIGVVIMLCLIGNISAEKIWSFNNHSLNISDSLIVDNNITTNNWFKGLFNWTTFTSWLGFDGSVLTFNETRLNDTIENVINDNGLGGNVSWNESYANLIYLNLSGKNANQNINISPYNLTADYIYGQPIQGGIDNGIIDATERDDSGNLNLTHIAGLDVSYPNMTVRLVSTITGEEVYCFLINNTVTVPDDAHTAYYVDTNCDLQDIPVSSFVDASLNNHGKVPVFHVMAHSGEIEVHQGLPILNKVYLRSRILSFKTINLDVISGLILIKEGALNFTITSGEYVFIDNAVSTTVQNLTDGAILEVFYRDGGNYQYEEYSGDTQTGLNLTSCEDASQNLVTCSSPTKYRRYFIFLTGYENGDDDTEIHQRLAKDDVTYSNIGDCLNTVDNPLTYELPDIYTYTAIPLYAYCGQANDDSFDGSFIDLKIVKSSSAGADIDTSIFLTKDGSRALTNDWDAGGFNISLDTKGWFNGLFNWTTLTSWLDFDGSMLIFNDTRLNTSLIAINDSAIGWTNYVNTTAGAYTDATRVLLQTNITDLNSSVTNRLTVYNNSAGAYTLYVNTTASGFTIATNATAGTYALYVNTTAGAYTDATRILLQTNITNLNASTIILLGEYNATAGTYADYLNTTAGAYTDYVNTTSASYTLYVNTTAGTYADYLNTTAGSYTDAQIISSGGIRNDTIANLTSLKMTTNFSVDDFFFVNGSNVGIGTATPSNVLTINKDSPAAEEVLFNITNNNVEKFAIDEDGDVILTNGRYLGWRSTTGAFSYNIRKETDNDLAFNAGTAGADIVFSESGGGKVVFTDEGSTMFVGIGTDSPDNELHVQGTIKSTAGLIRGYDQGVLGVSGGTSTILGANIWMYGESHASLANEIHFRDGTTVNAVIDTDGNVGIGTTSPLVNLQIADSSWARTSLENYNDDDGIPPIVYIRKSHTDTIDSFVQTIDGEKLGRLSFQGVGTDEDQWEDGAFIQATQTDDPAANAIATEMQFWTSAGGNPVQRMVIGDTGDVRIGPAAVDVTSTSAYGLQVALDTPSAVPTIQSHSALNLVQASATSDKIGMTFLSGTTGINEIDFADTAAGRRGRIVYNHDGDSMFFATAGTTALTLDSSQNAVLVGDLTVTGNDIKSSTATAITLSGEDIAVAEDLTVGGSASVGGATLDSSVGINVTNSLGGISVKVDRHDAEAYLGFHFGESSSYAGYFKGGGPYTLVVDGNSYFTDHLTMGSNANIVVEDGDISIGTSTGGELWVGGFIDEDGHGRSDTGLVVWCDGTDGNTDTGTECCAIRSMACSRVFVNDYGGGAEGWLYSMACNIDAGDLEFLAFCY